MAVLNPNAVKLVLPALLTSNDKWQANEARLNYIIALSKTAKVPLSKQLDTSSSLCTVSTISSSKSAVPPSRLSSPCALAAPTRTLSPSSPV